MCGIFAVTGSPDQQAARRAADLFSYRGPDGTYVYGADDVVLLQHRLAVIDTRDVANQPLWNDERTVGVLLNGEIYNYQKLKGALTGVSWRTEGDTEVVLQMYLHYGASFAEHLDGMYAIIILDYRSHTLVLLRDTFGIKPLYYAHTQQGMVCASEVKGVAQYLRDTNQPITFAGQYLDLYLTLGYVPTPDTIVNEIHMLEPGVMLAYSLEDHTVHTHQIRSRVEEEETPLVALKNSILANTVADVPLGLFLSGGIDSTFIAHTLAEAGMRPQAFTLAIPHRQDVAFAEHAARQYQLPHSTIEFTQERFERAYSIIRERVDAPTADSSLLPTLALATVARESVTVVLSGEGADEVFLGYERHKRLARMHSRRAGRVAGLLTTPLPRAVMSELAYYLQDAATLYALTAGITPTSLGVTQAAELFTASGCAPVDYDLRKIDMATMYVSLEGRVPCCSPHVFHAARSNEQELLRKGTKSLLKEELASVFPQDFITRKKSGFSAPFAMFAKHSKAVAEDSAMMRSFISERFPERAHEIVEKTSRNHYAHYAMLMLMHACRNLGI
jgi:asparagine synthase (glutamine-hydrolysing)